MKKILFLSVSLFLSVTVFAQLPPNIPASGLVGYWPFTGNANDQSVNLNNGTVNGALPTTDRFGNPNAAYNFNGTSDHINVPNNSTLSGFNDMTISVWVNMSQFSGIQAIVSKWFYNLNCGGNSDTYAFSLQNNMLVSATNNNNVGGFTAPQTFNTGDLNVWKHFVLVSNSTLGQQAIYINGVLIGTGAVSGTICNTTNPLIFGAAIPTFRWFKGKLDDIGIWNRVLTNCEIQQLYNGTGNTSINSSNNPICSSGSATLTATAGSATYLWNTGATTSVIVVSPTITTNYTVATTNTVTGCTNTATITQNVAGGLSLTASTSNSFICAGNSATLIANGNATNLFWTNSATSSVIVVSPSVTTSYTVFGINSVTGCTATAAVTQNVSSVTLTPTSSNTTICAGNSATLTVNGNATNYLWNTSSTNTAITVSPATTTIYTVSGTNTVTGCSSSTTITQNVSALPNVSVASSNTVLCAGNPVTLTASGANNYFWNTSATGASIVVSPTTSTSYTVIGTNAVTGCSNTATFTQNISSVNLSTSSSNSLICAGSSASLTVSGNATSYFWNTSATSSVIVVSPTTTTTYTVFGTNAVSGCTATAFVTQNVSACTGIQTNNLNNEINVYPNPASDNLNIRFNSSEIAELIVYLYDVTGKQLLKQKIHQHENNQINLASFNNGVYILRILDSESSSVQSEKIIVCK